jgi:hypothetical protein
VPALVEQGSGEAMTSKGSVDPEVLIMDRMTLMMLKHLKDHEVDEPPQPDETNSRYEAEEMTALHYEWSRAHQAIRLLLGVQLVNLAVEQMDPTEKGTV